MNSTETLVSEDYNSRITKW